MNGVLAHLGPVRPWASQPHVARRLGYARLVVSLLLLGLVASRLKLDVLRMLDVAWLGAACAVLVVSYVVAALKWRVHSPPAVGMSARRAVELYYVGLFWNNFLPSTVGGDAVRGWRAGEDPDTRRGAYLGILADRLTSAGTLFTLGLASCALGVAPDVKGLVPVLVGGWLVFCGGAAFMIARSESLAHLRSMRRLGLGILLGIVVQGMHVALNAFVLYAVTGSWHLGLVAVTLPIAGALSAAPVSVNGLGLREGALVGLLVAGGIPPSDAVAAALAGLVLLVGTSMIGGLLQLRTRARCRASSAATRDDDGIDIPPPRPARRQAADDRDLDAA